LLGIFCKGFLYKKSRRKVRVIALSRCLTLCGRFTCGLVYYSLALNTGSLYGDIFINTFIAGAVDIPAFLLCMFLMQWKLTGRKGTGCLGLIGAGISSFICIPMIIYSKCWHFPFYVFYFI